MNRVCITVPETGQRVCFNIPLLINRWWVDPNPPDPLQPRSEIERTPQPEPWILGADIKAEVSRELQALASIHALSDLLTEGSRGVLQQAVRSQVDRLQLPSGLHVHFDQPKRAA